MAKIIRVWDGSAWQEVGTALPNALSTDGTQTLTNKTISLGNNTITGTTAQFNTALSDANFATLAGSETLTNKTISGADNTLTNIPNNSLTNSSITINGSAVSLGGSTSITSLPSQTSNSGKYLTTDGTTSSWANVTNLIPIDSNISVPSAPTNVTASTGNAQATVSFDVSSDNGGSTILGYTIISNPGNIKKSTTLTTATVTGLTNGTAYTFTVKAHNIAGTSAASSASNSVTPTPSITVDYLVVAGGGSGGNGRFAYATEGGGGGGAGGMRCTLNNTGGGGSLESVLTLSPSTSYTVTVGGGGASVSTQSTNGNPGSNSVFSTITSTGGGYGGGENNGGGTGGSGGGGGAGTGGEASNLGGTRTSSPVQGFNGGNGSASGRAGGGGGASQVGANVIPSGLAGKGGDGYSTSISGSSITYAGGGGGGGYDSQGAGGSGGGGQGGHSLNSTPGTAGTANRGGGGGGIGRNGVSSGNGGSGVVILRALQAAASTTGSPTYTTSGSYHIYQFNSSGSITY